jgi:hypothetical protein
MLTMSSKKPTLAYQRAPAENCASCHSEIAREWKASLHHQSATNAAFVRALEREPLSFCRDCHTPSTRDNGIGCTDCHAGLPNEHATTHLPAKDCAACHEFAFPRGLGEGLMQKTVAEHEASAFADTACASCHMRSVTGEKKHRDHRFEVTPEMMKRAMVAGVTRASESRAAVRLKLGTVGHAFPTGDLFRRLSVEVESLDDEGSVLTRRRRYLSRHFTGKVIRVDGPDDRIGGSALEPCFEIDVGRLGANRPIRIAITHERVEEPRSAREEDAYVGARTLIWERHLEPASERRPCP